MAWPPVSEMLTATLVRNNVRWPAYITGNPWQRRVVDSLREGDRLTLPRCATGMLAFHVVEGFLRAALPIPRGEGTFLLATDILCPRCSHHGVHDIVAHTNGQMGRICCSCEHAWTQDSARLGLSA